MVVAWLLVLHGLCSSWVPAIWGKLRIIWGNHFLKETLHFPCFLKLLSLGAVHVNSTSSLLFRGHPWA